MESDSSTDVVWEGLVQTLIDHGTLKTPRIIQAFRSVPRHLFVPEAMQQAAASLDAPLPIGAGQTVSQPTTVAIMLELLQPAKADRVLDIGTGSGWQAALLGSVVAKQGSVDTLERIPQLQNTAARRLKTLGCKNVHSFLANATENAFPHDTYDVIVSAASSNEVPLAWIDHLANGGRLLHPIQDMGLRVIRKNKTGSLTIENYAGFVFVPLISES